MTTLREAAQMALTVLDGMEQNYGNLWQVNASPEGLDALCAALRAALAKPEPRNQCAETCERAKLCATCARGIDGAEQEPVVNAKAIAECLGVLRPLVKGKWPHEQALEELAGYTSPPIEATPLASQRSVKPWVGLTDEDKVEILRANGEAVVMMLTEAKLREKNT